MKTISYRKQENEIDISGAYIQALKLEPLFNTARDEIFGYEVLSLMPQGICAENWFSAQKTGMQISLLKKQLLRTNYFNEKRYTNTSLFFNITVDAMLSTSVEDIQFIASFKNISLEISDAYRIFFLPAFRQHSLFSQMEKIRKSGIDIWLDDFTFNELKIIDDIHDQFDGIKLDKSELHAPWLGEVLDVVRRVMGNIPLLFEGIETKKDLDILKMHNIELAQGYYWKSNFILL